MKCLLVCPHFSEFSYWNYTDVCELVGARYPAAPLGMVTVAALLPQDWEFRLLDLNVQPMDRALFDWADIVLSGGMIPQQRNLLKLIDLAHAHGKPIAVGGPDPTSQPEVYASADYRVLDEGEMTIPPFVADLRAGVRRGLYRSTEKPDVTTSPTPRFDLLDFSKYLHVGVQFSRGCPFNCEFCDIIELYGRRPRTKSREQMLRELETLRDLGYRGHVDFVDDNFIGNKKNVKEFLPHLIEWSRQNKHPFFFSTEASMNLADDVELMTMMQEADFRYVFVGIETPKEDLLVEMQKKQNTRHPIVESIRKIYEYGMIVNGGFIVGFDHEDHSIVDAMVTCIEGTGIAMAMVGLLTALPNTQLTRRLAKEGRLTDNYAEVDADAIDQTTSGLNFEPLRPAAEIIADYAAILERVYSPQSYFARVLQTARRLRLAPKHRHNLRKLASMVRGFARVVRQLGLKRATAGHFWRNLVRLALTHPGALESAVNLMAMYIHFSKQTAFNLKGLRARIAQLKAAAARGEAPSANGNSAQPAESPTRDRHRRSVTRGQRSPRPIEPAVAGRVTAVVSA